MPTAFQNIKIVAYRFANLNCINLEKLCKLRNLYFYMISIEKNGANFCSSLDKMRQICYNIG